MERLPSQQNAPIAPPNKCPEYNTKESVRFD